MGCQRKPVSSLQAGPGCSAVLAFPGSGREGCLTGAQLAWAGLWPQQHCLTGLLLRLGDVDGRHGDWIRTLCSSSMPTLKWCLWAGEDTVGMGPSWALTKRCEGSASDFRMFSTVTGTGPSAGPDPLSGALGASGKGVLCLWHPTFSSLAQHYLSDSAFLCGFLGVGVSLCVSVCVCESVSVTVCVFMCALCPHLCICGSPGDMHKRGQKRHRTKLRTG